MPKIYPDATTVEQMTTSGVQQLTGWLFETVASVSSRLQFLSVVFPNASPAAINETLGILQQGWQSAQSIAAGFKMPSPELIPINPNLAPNTFQVTAKASIPNPKNPYKPINYKLIVTLPEQYDVEELNAAIDEALNEELVNQPLYGPPALAADSGDIEIDPSVATVNLTSITRGPNE